MNVLLWILQSVLALLCVAGGFYKTSSSFDPIAKQFPALPRAGWRAVGALEIACGALLIVPAAVGVMPALTPLAAAVLVLETLGLSAVYARASTKVTAANPLVFSVVMAIVAAVVAFGRFTGT
jgi:hypothetical protein